MIPEKTIEELILKHSTLEKDLSSVFQYCKITV